MKAELLQYVCKLHERAENNRKNYSEGATDYDVYWTIEEIADDLMEILDKFKE